MTVTASCHSVDHKVIVAFWDARDAYNVYKELSLRAVRFSTNVEAQQLRCLFITEAEVREVRRPRDVS